MVYSTADHISMFYHLMTYFLDSQLLWQPLTKTVNNALSNLIRWESHGNHKRTWQEVPNIFLHCIYYYYKFYPKLHMFSMNPLYHYHKANMLQLAWYGWTHIFYFYFYFIYFLWFNIYFSFTFCFFYFLDNEEAHDCGHMMHHMTWYHRSKTW